MYPFSRKSDIHVLLMNHNKITGINQVYMEFVLMDQLQIICLSLHTEEFFFLSPGGIESKKIQQYLNSIENFDFQKNLSCWQVPLKDPT